MNDLDKIKAALAVRLQLPSGVTASDSNIRSNHSLSMKQSTVKVSCLRPRNSAEKMNFAQE